jgi:hypothetical protein
MIADVRKDSRNVGLRLIWRIGRALGNLGNNFNQIEPLLAWRIPLDDNAGSGRHRTTASVAGPRRGTGGLGHALPAIPVAALCLCF